MLLVCLLRSQEVTALILEILANMEWKQQYIIVLLISHYAC
jgi:hypothetical protein